MADFKELDPLLHSQLRLAIMSLLMSVESAEFVYIKEKTGATAGNLSVQLDKLATAGYIGVSKEFKGKKPLTTCSITKRGIEAFEKYVESLKTYFKN
ncbi:winged helix-turn-helix domain-containing protein [Fulvivirga lutea]|uniref:Transcriptional regulator n=1 Tax=Fulvivirga lutea TaxID=2810512 RepID=A0A974WG14_9BACT|nr:transcriptional regulator [Fulvivirga lutea]QSE96908.1 transcriptional regulator [Fulvivirga lutea]